MSFTQSAGRFPASSGEIDNVQASALYPEGSDDGFHFVFTPGTGVDFDIVATHAVPGVTGGDVCHVTQEERVRARTRSRRPRNSALHAWDEHRPAPGETQRRDDIDVRKRRVVYCGSDRGVPPRNSLTRGPQAH
jgi:hypothetical protein